MLTCFFVMDGRSSLFYRSISDEEKSFYNLDTWLNMAFMLVGANHSGMNVRI
jgi:hypothetical protein